MADSFRSILSKGRKKGMIVSQDFKLKGASFIVKSKNKEEIKSQTSLGKACELWVKIKNPIKENFSKTVKNFINILRVQ